MEVNSKSVFELMVSLCRIHDLDQARTLDVIENNKIDWNLFLACCFKNKVAGLVYSNIKRLKIQSKIPHRILYVIKYFHYCNKMRNKVILKESKLLSNELVSNDVPALFLKGSILLPVIYKDEGARMLNDIDVYIKKSSRAHVNEIMESLGYVQGEFNEETQEVEPITYQEKLMWKLKMFNLPPYHKVIIEGLQESVAVDYSFGLSFSQKSDLSEIMFVDPVYRADLPTLSPIKLFIQICCHLHKEATNSAWQEIGQDINLIKFCDVREAYYEFVCEEGVNKLTETAKLLGVESAVRYSLKHTAVIYSDDELAIVADTLKLDDDFDESNIYCQDNNVVGKRTLSIPEMISSLFDLGNTMMKTNMFDLQNLVLELAEGSALEGQDIQASTPLRQVGFDSLKIVQLIMEIEERLQLSIIDQDVDLQDFYSIETIQRFLTELEILADD